MRDQSREAAVEPLDGCRCVAEIRIILNPKRIDHIQIALVAFRLLVIVKVISKHALQHQPGCELMGILDGNVFAGAGLCTRKTLQDGRFLRTREGIYVPAE